jgi:death-on-curing protein
MTAAAYMHALISNHAFHNGNKRTALVATLVFLDLNDYVLEIEEDPLFDYLIKVAAHEVVAEYGEESRADAEMLAVAKWISRHSRPIIREEHPLQFNQLREILNAYGCTFEHPRKGNRINIQRGEKRIQIYYRNEGSDVELNTIRKIRKDLSLTEDDGYDSTIFYNREQRIPDFIHKYRRTLQRLAKV